MDSLGTDFDALLTRGALVALALGGCWAVVVVLAVALEARTGGRIGLAERAGCPTAVRLWLLGIFVAIFAATAPANASDTGSGTAESATGVPLDVALDGLPLPDRVAGASVRTVVVLPGDSLWRIAQRLLPPGASDPEIVSAVRRLYADNRRIVGSDPDLIEPGQRLLVHHPDNTPEAR